MININEWRHYLNHKVSYRKTHKNKVPLMMGNEVVEWPVDQAQLTRRYTEKAQAFISENKDKPFFLYLAHAMPHMPLYASEAFAGKTEHGLYGDVIEELDWSVGQVLKTLRKNGLDKNTLVIFTSDNGPWLRKLDEVNAESSAAVQSPPSVGKVETDKKDRPNIVVFVADDMGWGDSATELNR